MDEEDDIYDDDEDDYEEPDEEEIDSDNAANNGVKVCFAPVSSFDRDAMRSILDECLDQLFILRNINTQDNANFINETIEYASIAERYKVAENHANFRINSTIDNYEKLARDIHWIIQVIRNGQDELDTSGQFNSMITAIETMSRMFEDEKNLLEERAANEKYIVELRKQCEDEWLKNKNILDETNAKIQKLRFEVEDLLVYTRYELNYFENWERTRREQNALSCEKKELHFQTIINETRNKIDAENRCHMELESYIEQSKNDYLDEIQYWMKHYDEETERRETEMINLKANLEKMLEDRELLQQKYDSRKAEIDDWLAYKRKKKEKEEFEALQLWAVIKIQAWWRGVMFRKKLGPYRKKKGKGKDKDKKGKGKGGKKKK